MKSKNLQVFTVVGHNRVTSRNGYNKILLDSYTRFNQETIHALRDLKLLRMDR